MPLLQGTELAPIAMPDGLTGLGVGEMSFLLTRHDGPQADRTLEFLSFERAEIPEQVRLAGASSLVARGLLRLLPDGRLEPLSVAALVDFAATTATRWTKIQIISDHGDDTVVLLQAPGAIVLLQPRALGTWFATASGYAGRAADVVMRVVRDLVTLHPEASLAVASGDLHRRGGSIFLRREGERWDVVDRTSDPDTEERQLFDTATLRERLSLLLFA